MGRVAILTCGDAVGQAAAEALAAQGWTTILNDAGGGGTPAAQWDVGHPGSCAEMVAAVEAQVGPVGILVNNHLQRTPRSFSSLHRDDWDRAVGHGLGGCWNMVRALWPALVQRGFGRIVNVGAMEAQRGCADHVAFCAAAAGLQGFTKSLALEGGKAGVTANLLALGRIGEDPDAPGSKDAARAIAFLCSEDASAITGATLSVNGGAHMF